VDIDNDAQAFENIFSCYALKLTTKSTQMVIGIVIDRDGKISGLESSNMW